MAALGALAHWRSLPFPIRIGAGLLGFLLVTWLSRSRGGTSIVIAAALWLGALAGLLYAGGGLRWLGNGGGRLRQWPDAREEDANGDSEGQHHDQHDGRNTCARR